MTEPTEMPFGELTWVDLGQDFPCGKINFGELSGPLKSIGSLCCLQWKASFSPQ